MSMDLLCCVCQGRARASNAKYYMLMDKQGDKFVDNMKTFKEIEKVGRPQLDQLYRSYYKTCQFLLIFSHTGI